MEGEGGEGVYSGPFGEVPLGHEVLRLENLVYVKRRMLTAMGMGMIICWGVVEVPCRAVMHSFGVCCIQRYANSVVVNPIALRKRKKRNDKTTYPLTQILEEHIRLLPVQRFPGGEPEAQLASSISIISYRPHGHLNYSAYTRSLPGVGHLSAVPPHVNPLFVRSM